jgi:predicted dehydrogenase/threonine dehydrogenase-like Zn-dependent dehydrogenase
MKQFIQDFKTGKLQVYEVPKPQLSKGMVLIENKFSLISAGTERTTVSTGQASLLGKAKKRPDLVQQVLSNVKKEGLKATIEKVRTRLSSLKSLGYSSAGAVLASMDAHNKFKPGDRVACGGLNYATHAEIVTVPHNLVAKIPDNVSYEDAAYTTLGAIALQGVRQADPKIGENICVIGLGLLGQITCQILKANGCNVFGIDISKNMVQLANQLNAAKALARDDSGLTSAIEAFTNGHGFDKVILTVATKSSEPIDFAGEILRHKGTVVVVGGVKMDIPRNPNYYPKELELKLSCSYGPGRYDPSYEEEGVDYPYGYVRWTEQRNMEAFLNLLSQRVIDLKPLTTHIYDIDEAEKGYDLILGKIDEPYIGILLRYPGKGKDNKTLVKVNDKPAENINIGFIGAGNFAQSYLIPTAKKLGSLDTIVNRTGISSRSVAEKFGFNNSSTSADDILKNNKINTLFIATNHDTHAEYVVKGLKAGKNVFVEKPLAINYEEVEEIVKTYNKCKNPKLMVGFNRRFAPVSVKCNEIFKNSGEPIIMNFRVNTGSSKKVYRTQNDPGLGRVVGEICHFIDLMQYLAGSNPVKVFAECIDMDHAQIRNDDNICIGVKFQNGSIGNLTYVANGDSGMPKEYFEIFGGRTSFVIDNFKQGVLYHKNKIRKIKNSGKGHKQEIECFIKSIAEGSSSPISFESILYTTITTFKILDSLGTGLPQKIELL